MSKGIKVGAVIVTVVLAIGFFFTPHITAVSMKQAAELRDSEKLASYVDFPALKENLKGQINAKFAADLAGTEKSNPYAGLGMVLAAAFISPMIDALVTPENLRHMMKGNKPTINTPDSKSEPQPNKSEEDVETKMSYSGLNKFVVSVRQKGEEKEVVFVLNRDGIISWKLVAIQLPL